jgi:hypothetical protein
VQTQSIDDVHRTLSKLDDADKVREGKRVIESLGALKYEMLHDRKMTYELFRSTAMADELTAAGQAS